MSMRIVESPLHIGFMNYAIKQLKFLALSNARERHLIMSAF